MFLAKRKLSFPQRVSHVDVKSVENTNIELGHSKGVDIMGIAEQLISRYNMNAHIENGMFIERHYPATGDGRPASGSIYYYVKPGERTQFHKIDCDEYWSFNAGATLELWVIGLDGRLSVKHCGIMEDAEPTIRFAAGEIFASRLDTDAPEGTFITCITVPRFTYDGFQMYEKAEIIRRYPETTQFWEK